MCIVVAVEVVFAVRVVVVCRGVCYCGCESKQFKHNCIYFIILLSF